MNNKKSFNCIIDARVSLDKQLDGRSLEDQEIVCRRLAAQKSLSVIKCFSKSYSGRSEERKDFEEIITFIKSKRNTSEQIDYYLVKSIDRFTRGGHMAYTEMKNRIKEVGVTLIDTYGIIQSEQNTLGHLGVTYKWSIYEPSETSELLEANRSKNEVRDILTRMVGAEIGYAREGFSVRAAADGYKNVKEIRDGKQRTVLMKDSDRAGYHREMIRLRALGTVTDADIVRKLNVMGYRSKPHKQWIRKGGERLVVGMSQPTKLTVKKLQKIISRPIYAGIKVEKWLQKPVFAQMAENNNPIVSIAEFNKANRGKIYIKVTNEGEIQILENYSERATAKRLKFHPDYKFDKLIVCNVCRKPYKNSGKGNKGKSGKMFQAYHCDRSCGGVKHYERIPKAEFEYSVTKLLKNLKFKDEFLRKLEDKLIKKYREREKEILEQSICVGTNVTELKIRQSNLLAKLELLTSPLVIKKTEHEIESLETQIIDATEARDKLEIKERDIKSFVKYAKDLMEHPIKILGNNNDPYKQKAFFTLVFKQMPSHSEILNGTPKLSLVFKLSEDFKVDESSLVTLRRIELRFLG